MDSKEKWGRMNNPQSSDDYSLAISEDELRTFPEGRKILADMKKYNRMAFRNQSKFENKIRRLGMSAAEHMSVLASAILTHQKPSP